jgi:hypothetical protein
MANKANKSLADCTTFQQNDKGDDAVEMTIHNSCTIPVDCSVSWRVVCAPDSAKRKNVHDSSKKFSLTSGTEQSAQADATICGDDGWSIDSIKWGCEPNKD